MDMKGKTNDSIKAKINITLFCHHKNMELIYARSWVANPKVSFVLDKNAQLLVYQWLKSLCFPDGHASNISRLVYLEDCRLYGMKSYDCHVFIQILILLAYHDLLSNEIWDALTEISHFFRNICSNKLQKQHIERLEMNIVKTIYISPSFFEHFIDEIFNISDCFSPSHNLWTINYFLWWVPYFYKRKEYDYFLHDNFSHFICVLFWSTFRLI